MVHDGGIREPCPYCDNICGNIDWDMSLIGEIADMAADVLVRLGYMVRYPAIVEDADGTERIVNYHNEN